MPSCAGTGMVTICMLTLRIRSTTGISMVSPGRGSSGCARPNRNTMPRSFCLTTRALVATTMTTSATTKASL